MILMRPDSDLSWLEFMALYVLRSPDVDKFSDIAKAIEHCSGVDASDDKLIEALKDLCDRGYVYWFSFKEGDDWVSWEYSLDHPGKHEIEELLEKMPNGIA